MAKYILSMKHTKKSDCFLTFWKPDSKGYCFSLNWAGLYENPKPGYHDYEDNMPVDSEIIERMGSTVMYEGQLKTMVPQNRYVLAELGLRRTSAGLRRIKS